MAEYMAQTERDPNDPLDYVTTFRPPLEVTKDLLHAALFGKHTEPRSDHYAVDYTDQPPIDYSLLTETPEVSVYRVRAASNEVSPQSVVEIGKRVAELTSALSEGSSKYFAVRQSYAQSPFEYVSLEW